MAYSHRVMGVGFILMTAAWLATASLASAATLQVGDATAQVGGAARVAVKLDNPEDDVRALQFSLRALPAGVEFVGAEASGRSAGLTADAQQQPDGTVKVVLISLGEQTVAAGSGPVLDLHFRVHDAGSTSAALMPMEVVVAGTTGALDATGEGGQLHAEGGSAAPTSGGGCAVGPTRSGRSLWLVLVFAVAWVIGRSTTRTAGHPGRLSGLRHSCVGPAAPADPPRLRPAQPARLLDLRFISVAVAALVSMVACAAAQTSTPTARGSWSPGQTATPTPTPCVDMSWTWTGSYAQNTPGTNHGSLTVQITQAGSQISGTIEIAPAEGTPVTGTISGTIQGCDIMFGAVYGPGLAANYEGSLGSPNEAHGSYTTPMPEEGTWQITRQEPTCSVFPPAGQDAFGTRAEVTLQITAVGLTATVALSGPTVIQRGDPFAPRDSPREILTEMISMNLSGSAPVLGALTLIESPTLASLGRVKAQNVDVDFPADSFFDVFFEVETTLPSPLDRLHNADPLRMRQVIDCIPPVGAIYQPPPGGQRVPLYDAAGNQIGTLVHAQHEVPSVWCGDGVVDPSIGEQCDDGNTADCDGCDRNCKLTACGNNIICPPEQCDDGNTTPGDGCDAACQIEAPMATPTATATSTPSRTPTLTPTPTGTLAVLRVGNVVMRPGQQHVGVPLFLDNNLKVRALQFALTDVPDEVVLSATTPACSTTSRSSGLALDCNETGGAIRGVLLSTGTATIAPGSGSIATVFVDDTAPSCALGQTIQLNLSDTAVADDNSNPVPHTTVNGTLRCGCPEDLNCDTRVDIFDALICVDLILGRDPERCADSDLDCNGRTDIFDCLLIVDSILGRRPACE